MATVSISIRKDSNRKDNNCLVYLSFYLNREKIRINTEVLVDSSSWDEDNKVIKGRDQVTVDKNLIISQSIAYITDIMVRYRLMRKKLTKEIFEKEWENREGSRNFIVYMQKRCDEKLKQDDIAKSTHTTQKGVVEDLRKFKKSIPFNDLNEKFIKDFRSHLKKQQNSVNTIDKKFRILHAYFTDAIKDKMIDENPLDNVKKQVEDVDVNYLDEFELNRIINKYKERSLSPERHHVCRMFLFACFTGLRISDAMAVSMEDLRYGYLQIRMKKTTRTSGRITRIPITHSINTLVNEANPEQQPGKIFKFQMTEQNINRNLKHIASACDITKSISFKTARHTFGYLYYKRTKDLLALKELMGHSKIEQTLVYAHLNDQDVLDGMAKFDTWAIEPTEQQPPTQ
jgi:integrase/recombinase XerD